MKLIDADEFRKRINHYPPEIRDIAQKELRYTHTIEERKTGRWIDEGQYADFFPHHAFCCSECGHHLLEIEVVYDYCPFCGAKMEGGQD